MPRARISRFVFGVLFVLFGVLPSLCAERAEIVACARPRTRNLPGLLARRTPRTRPCPCYPRFAQSAGMQQPRAGPAPFQKRKEITRSTFAESIPLSLQHLSTPPTQRTRSDGSDHAGR
jgi:hypothetical protein